QSIGYHNKNIGVNIVEFILQTINPVEQCMSKAAMKQYRRDIAFETPVTPISESTVEDRGDGTEPIIEEWRPVTPPPLPITHNDSSIKKEFKDDPTLDSKTQHASTTQIDEDEEDPDDLRNFKIVEKSFLIDNYEELDQE
ncbi:11653_t:CDS:2, partial [Scutellospora calospora]